MKAVKTCSSTLDFVSGYNYIDGKTTHINILHFYFHMRKSISISFGKYKPHGLPERRNKLRLYHFSRRVERRSRIGMALHTEPRRNKTALITKFPFFLSFSSMGNT